MRSKERLKAKTSDKNNYNKLQLPFITEIRHKTNTVMVSSMSKQESFDSTITNSSLEILKSKNCQVPVVSSIAYATRVAVENTNVNHSPKIGSRRIFTPHFKLQVLESYRNDSDCKGNQRATARKYNIHRRQIQKWLQCETNLRSSVANTNKTNVNHQFHNISHLHQFQQQHQQLPMSTNSTVSSSQFNGRHIQQNKHLPHKSDSECLLSLANNQSAVMVPLIENAALSAHGVIASKNLSTVIAATGAMSLANTTKKNMTVVISPLRTTTSSSNEAIVARSVHPHYQHYPIPYTQLSDNGLVSVPITHYIPSHHHHQYQNQFHHSHSLMPQLPSSFRSTVSLSGTVLSAPVCATSEMPKVQNNVTEWKEELQTEENKYVNQVCSLKENENNNENYLSKNNLNKAICYREDKSNNNNKCKSVQQNLSATPMDLSIGPRRELFQHIEVDSSEHKDVDFLSCTAANSRHTKQEEIGVDLTFRKRKFYSNVVTDIQAEKLIKLEDGDVVPAVDESFKIEVVDYHGNKEDNIEEIEIDVEERTAPPKPLKLFKPYLLDKEDIVKEKSSYTLGEKEQRDPIIWSHHPECVSPKIDVGRQNFSIGSAFHSPPLEIFPAMSSCFHAIAMSSSSFKYNTSSPLSDPELPFGGLPCPKGSPVSGYESSSSTYSDSSSGGESREHICNNRPYSIDLKLHPICNEDLILNKSHIQKWLDQGTNKTTPNASIALYI